MIEEAVREYGLNLENSFAIGDNISDIEAGCRAGCRTILLGGEGSLGKKEEVALMAGHIATDLYEAVKWLVKFSRQ